jgi:hypothetical protein
MFTQRIALSNQDARAVNSTKLHALGTVAETADGRVFRYALAGASNLAAGLVNTSAAKVTNHTNNAVATAANVGDRQVNITLAGATATTAGQYDGGYLVVNDSAGVGCAYRISGTPVIAGSGTGIIQLHEAIATALTTSSKVSLQYSPWANTIVHAGSTAALFCNGTNNVAVTAANYYWSQTGGMASVLSDGIIGKGSGAILTTNAVAGALLVEGTSAVTQRVATAVEATVDTKYYPVFLTLE